MEEPQIADTPEVAVGTVIEWNGRKYEVESIGEISSDVSMRDITFHSEVGFPINRIEKLHTVREWLKEQPEQEIEPQMEQPLAPSWEQPKEVKLKSIVIDLTQPRVEKHNFRITDDELGYGGAKAKYQMNVAAIRTLQTIEAERRLAIPEEQKILSRYVGWGGCADAFDASKENWRAEYAELKGLLTESECESARESTLNSHYTSPTVIKAIYNCIFDMGFTTGNVLDPPYNTGHDFIYNDRFEMDKQDYAEQTGLFDEDENRNFVENTDSNGRFHSDWCCMMLSRLLLARNLLSSEGVIFISIDEHELETLTKLCDEAFGESNHIGTIVIKSNPRGSMSTSEIASLHEYLIMYAKSRLDCRVIGHELSKEMASEYKFKDKFGVYRLLGLRMRGGFWRRSERPNLFFPIYVNSSDGSISLVRDETHVEEVLPIQPSTMEDGTWRWGQEKIEQNKGLLFGKTVSRNNVQIWDIYQKDYLDRSEGRRTKAKSIWDDSDINYQNGAIEIKTLFGKSGVFDYAKPVFFIQQMLKMIAFENGDTVLDFFSGSATTAHAVMQLNAEDGGHRKFIMVQLPETCDEKSEAYKAGYKNICEIGKERIRRAGEKIKCEVRRVESGVEGQTKVEYNSTLNTPPSTLDIGFRVFKLDDTNMKDVYYGAAEYTQTLLDDMTSNIKEDRTDMDLLYGCLLEWGLPLSLPQKTEQINGCTVHTYGSVESGELRVGTAPLIACFDNNIPETVIREIAGRKPLRVVFRDSSFASSPEKINVTEIFKLLAPNTSVKVI